VAGIRQEVQLLCGVQANKLPDSMDAGDEGDSWVGYSQALPYI